MNPLWVLVLLTSPLRDTIMLFEPHFLDLAIAISLDVLPALDYSEVSFVHFGAQAFTIDDLI